MTFDACLYFVIDFHNKTEVLLSTISRQRSAVFLFTLVEEALIDEAFLIKLIAEWEIFVQNIFAYCIAKDTARINDTLNVDLSSVIGFNNAYAILNGVDFLSLTTAENVRNLAKKLITPLNNPFEKICKETLKSVDDVYTLRNYLVHKSRRSKDRLMKFYRDKYHRSDFISPGEFLREAIDGYDAKIERSCGYYGAFMSIATDVWKFLDPHSYKYVFEDDTTFEGLKKGTEKMEFVFLTLSKNYNIDYFPGQKT